VKEASSRTKSLSFGRDLLCIQDTCEVNLGKHKGRLKENSGLGQSDKGQSGNCFKVHPGLVMDAATFSPLGFSHIKVFHRPEDRPDKHQRNYKKQNIEEKESYKWIEVALKSKETLENANSVTFIEDREGDIFEQFVRIPNEKFHLLIRSRANRKTKNGNLYNDIGSQPIAGTYQIEIPTDNRKKQFKRIAQIELRFGESDLVRPKYLKKGNGPDHVKVYCISVREKGTSSKPVHWKLLTTHKITNYDQALRIVEFYSARWYIEQLFRLLKKQGFGIEETELESGWAIRKLVVMQ
ncbi:IS4 family transposase, partial [Salegentibacter sp. LM13S]|uniref:IS4 family transposase n=1 Tax=Salegentibacter lacus TaxID=2873599 RepID=UPI001CCF0FFB